MFPPGAPQLLRVLSLRARARKLPPAAPAAEAAPVGANRYMMLKFRIEPTTNVEKTKSSSLRPQFGLEDMSPTTDAPTPITCSMATLTGSSGSYATRSSQPLRIPALPWVCPPLPSPEDSGCSSPSPLPRPPSPPPDLPPPSPLPPLVLASLLLLLLMGLSLRVDLGCRLTQCLLTDTSWRGVAAVRLTEGDGRCLDARL
mmetsp:Transcript_27654/g.74842  ORF Transcript_27654/g.74842 Transcript_27654/m.74842 type:complete len:200 (-) Transcript_27654:68-667(-)